MESKKVIRLSAYPEEKAIRAGEFSLMPSNPALPSIVSQPIQNFQQYTWISGDNNGTPKYQQITPNYNTINLIEGTSFSFETRVVDPSNVVNINDTAGLSFLWRKDDAPVFELNRLNGGVGTSAAMIMESDSKVTLSGRYVCEVSNQYGTVETQAFTLNVIDPHKHPKLYKNLIVNGDGDGGLQNWTGNDIKVSPFLNDASITKGFGSFRLGNFSMLDQNKSVTGTPPTGFYFSLASHWGLFYNHYKKRLDNDPTFSNIDLISKSRDVLREDERWISEGITHQIIANEDFNEGKYAAFFPGIAWMDKYNKNNSTKLIGLSAEFKDYIPTYFTREKIKFVKVGGTPTVSMNQVIDISEASELVDGNVYGVNQVVSQFFAYVGIGISDYQINIQTTEGSKTLNYYVADSEEVYSRVVGADNSAVTVPKDEDRAKKLKMNGSLFTLIPNTPIEIVPRCYDKTNIILEYLSVDGRVLKVQEIAGPQERDIWAVKEKTFFPLTLYGLYEFIKPSDQGNDITVFGQKYTNTNAIKILFDRSQKDLFLHPSKQAFTKAALKDVAARFLMNKWDFETWGQAYPGPIWFAANKAYRAASDNGAAAMFGVGKDVIVPRGTRSIRVTVVFDHKSEMVHDSDPLSKGWKDDYIYTNEFGNHNSTSIRTTEYGNPRCGIAKMKLQLFPNKVEVNNKTLTYSLPPSDYTVLGLAKRLYQDPSAFNTADADNFNYRMLQPTGLPTTSSPQDTLMTIKSYNTYLSNQEQEAVKASVQYPDGLPEEVVPTTDEIVAQEDDHYTSGDFNQSMQIPEDQIDPGME